MSGYRAFISYAHKDEVWARKLQRKLESFHHPEICSQKWPLRPVFLDRTELSSSPDLSDSVNGALTNSDALVVICSPAAAASKWVNAEIHFFKQLGKKAIYPIIISGNPGSNVPGEECFPRTLRYQIDETGALTSSPAEPLAADARKWRDRNDAILRLIAGLMGVPFDSLKLRQHRRRLRQAVSLAAVATTLVVFTSYLAIVALTAQQTAERRRDQAENLIAFMLGDLRNRLQPVGRLDLLDGIGEQALNYFSSLTKSELTSEALLSRATALRQIGEVRVAQGLINEGLVAFNEALNLLSSSSTPNQAVRLFELGQVNYWIANAYFKDLKLEQAQQYIETYLNISRELVELEPTNPDYQRELLYAESNLGTLALRANNLDSARVYFNNAVSVGRDIAAAHPGDENEAELAITISWLGALEAAAGNFAASLNWYEKQLALRRNLMGRSEDPSRKHSVGRALFLLAGIQAQVGSTGEAATALSESVQLYRELVAYDPQNYEWQEELAWSLTALARESYTLGTSTADEAAAMLALASEAIARVDQEDTAEVNRVYAAIDLERGRLELLDGHAAIALTLSQQAVKRLAPFISGDDRVRVLPLYAKASYVAAEAALAEGDKIKSGRLAKSALAFLELRQDDPVEVQAYAALLAFLSGNPSAGQLLSAVAETEYRAVAYLPKTEAERWWAQLNY